MRRLTDPLDALATIEAEHARRTHGPDYASHHEGFGVLAEEVQETDDELRTMQRHIEHLLREVRAENSEGIRLTLGAIRQDAVRAAAEALQVAAVCEKFARSCETDERSDNNAHHQE